MKSELFSGLADINFIEVDPEKIEREILSNYENLTGRTLAPGDPERVFLDGIILIIIQQRNFINYVGRMNLLAYAEGDYLDHLGAFLGVERLEAEHATSIIQFTLSKVQPATCIIPAGTRITPDGKIYFAVNETAEIPAGELSCECLCTCTDAGKIGNGFLPGQINRLVDIFPYETSAVNLTISSGGTDAENDENFRERIQIAPESFSTAGSINGYKYYVRSAHSDIIDVAILTPPEISPGHVDIYPLMKGGNLPNDEVIAAVYEKCNADDIRPDTDYVTVKKPEVINFNVSFNYWIDNEKSSQAYSITEKVESAVTSWITWQRSKLGRDINPSVLISKVIEAGAKRCEISSPNFQALKKNQVAFCVSRNIIYSGLEE